VAKNMVRWAATVATMTTPTATRAGGSTPLGTNLSPARGPVTPPVPKMSGISKLAVSRKIE